MGTMHSSLEDRFPGTSIAEGAQIGEGCRIDEGCEISAETVIKQGTALYKNVQITGKVQVDEWVVIRENVTLVGPLHIRQNSFIGQGSILGATREDGTLADKTLANKTLANKPTIIGEYCRIGKEVEILGGVQVGAFARVRAGSRVIGDVPQYGIASRAPAILERFCCPSCGGKLMVSANHGGAILVKCTHCNQAEINFNDREWAQSPKHVLLPGGALGAEVSTLGDDWRWLDEWEMR